MARSPILEVGGAWRKKKEDGSEYVSIALKPDFADSGNCGSYWIDLVKNTRKTMPKHPDYIVTARLKEGATAGGQSQPPPQKRREESEFP